MDQEENRQIPIPIEYHSFSTGGLFERCIDCDRNVLEDGCEYFIEKAIKKYEGFDAHDVIFEYAICINCAEKMRKRMSKESMESIERYFMENVDQSKRFEVMMQNPDNPIAWMNSCIVKGIDKNELQEYQIYAHCKGEHLQMSHMPYMVSGHALDEISHLLSNETLDELDKFMNNNFGPPPELMEPIPSRRLVLI